jgi:D-threonate/D-erythronate kinase
VVTLPSAWPADVDVLSIDLEARELPGSDARQVMCQAAQHLRSAARLLLKIDSTLRGPIAAMIDGALEGSGCSSAVVAPAFPEQGRDIVDGRLHVHGSPRQTVPDVGSPLHDSAELDALATAWPAHPEWLLAGSAGIARRLAGPATERVTRPPSGSVLVVAGSPAEATRRQLERLPPTVRVLSTSPTELRDTGDAARALADTIDLSQRPGLLMLTGGATARAVCARLGASGIRLHGEVQPGMPVGTLLGGVWDGVLVLTKAGGFGPPDALLDALRVLGPSCLDTP